MPTTTTDINTCTSAKTLLATLEQIDREIEALEESTGRLKVIMETPITLENHDRIVSDLVAEITALETPEVNPDDFFSVISKSSI